MGLGVSLLLVVMSGALAQAPSSQSAPAPSNPSTDPFPDFEYLPSPSQYAGRVFRLSQQYPSELPGNDRMPDFLKIDFKTSWREYLMAAREYCFKGNITPGGDLENDWRVADQNPPRWFHMPWQHYGPLGREGVHGLTQEAPVQPKQLSWTQTYTGGTTFAIGFFNDFAGYTIGQIWKDHNNPDLSKGPFPSGAVICKILFVDVPFNQVPCLNPPLHWRAYVPKSYTSSPLPTTTREFKQLSLVQMDLMVRDPRSPLGWVFGNYQYNGATNHQNLWENLVPLGIQWGNDPEVTTNTSNPMPVATMRNPALKETIINDDANELPPTHLGWNGRLCGPVDNPMSSCMSCHSTAQYPVVSALNPLFQEVSPPPGSKDWMFWFRNLKCGEPFNNDPANPTQSTDFSLQLADSVQNFRAWQAAAKGLSASEYHARQPAAGLQASPLKQISPYKMSIGGKEQYKIRRDQPQSQ
jgi:hypothetical protein